MGQQKTVVLLNHTAALGGGEYALLRLIRSLDRRFWCPVAVFGEEGPAVQALRSRSIETYVLPLGARVKDTRRHELERGAFSSAGRLLEAGAYGMQLSRFLQERSPDLVHTNSLKSHILGGFAASLAGLPVVWHLRDSIEPAHLPAAAVSQIRFLAKWIPKAIVCVSRSVAAQIGGSDMASGKTSVVYDGLEDAAFEEPAEISVRRPMPSWRVGMVGRLSRWKGQHVFLEAAAILKGKGYSIEWEVVGGALFGEDEYAEGLRRQVSSRGLSKCVRFFGQIPDVGQRLRSWHVSVHASTASDPCPNVVLESMAAGVAVVGSAGGGVPELLDEGRCGELFPMGDSFQLAEAIERLLLQKERRQQLVRQAKDRAQCLFRSERVAREVSLIWNRVLTNRPPSRRARNWIEKSERWGGSTSAQKAP